MSRRNKRKGFRDNWASQTDIGKRYGMSAIAVGKVLAEHGLRDATTRLATPKALTDGWCVETPLQSGAMHYMWAIGKVRDLLGRDGHATITRAEREANELIATIKHSVALSADGNDKLAFLQMDYVFLEVPTKDRPEIAKHLRAKGYGEYAEGWWDELRSPNVVQGPVQSPARLTVD